LEDDEQHERAAREAAEREKIVVEELEDNDDSKALRLIGLEALQQRAAELQAQLEKRKRKCNRGYLAPLGSASHQVPPPQVADAVDKAGLAAELSQVQHDVNAALASGFNRGVIKAPADRRLGIMRRLHLASTRAVSVEGSDLEVSGSPMATDLLAQKCLGSQSPTIRTRSTQKDLQVTSMKELVRRFKSGESIGSAGNSQQSSTSKRGSLHFGHYGGPMNGQCQYHGLRRPSKANVQVVPSHCYFLHVRFAAHNTIKTEIDSIDFFLIMIIWLTSSSIHFKRKLARCRV